jgi:hypothetical protein
MFATPKTSHQPGPGHQQRASASETWWLNFYLGEGTGFFRLDELLLSCNLTDLELGVWGRLGDVCDISHGLGLVTRRRVVVAGKKWKEKNAH